LTTNGLGLSVPLEIFGNFQGFCGVEEGLVMHRPLQDHRCYETFDDRPQAVTDKGLRLLDRATEICARHGIYTIIDLHAARTP
jgi:hypothetical protein